MVNIQVERKGSFFLAILNFIFYSYYNSVVIEVLDNIRMFREWLKLAKPHKRIWIYQFITVFIPSFCLLAEAIYAAWVTTSLADNNYGQAIFYLSIVLLFMLLRNLAEDLNYRNAINLIGHTYNNIQSQIFDKIALGKEKNFINNSKEKLINIFHSDVYDVANFSNIICNRFKFFFQIILTVTYIFFMNTYVGLVVIIIFIINYIVMDRINSMISKANKEVKEAVDEEFMAFSEIIDSKNILEDLNITKKIKENYQKSNKHFLKKMHNYNIKTSYLDNYFFIFYQLTIFIGTLLLIFMLSKELITLTAYLVIGTYLTNSITSSTDFLNILTDLKNTYVAANRVNIILNFDLKEQLEFGSLNKDDIHGEIDFLKVNYTPKEEDIGLTKLKNISFHIPTNKIVLFKGYRNSGKRTIFYLLRRVIMPDSGEVYIDKINIKDFTKKVYKTNINYLTTKPYFYEGTALSNLKLVKNKKEEIISACKMANVYDLLMKYPKGLNTNIKELSQKELYLLSLARLLLMNSEILVLYEFPVYLSQKDEEIIKNVLKSFKGKKTILIFSAHDNCEDIVDITYTIEKGELKK